MKPNLDTALTTRSPERLEGEPLSSEQNTHALFVIPRERGGGFQASICGHILELADPRSGHKIAPTPGDLFVVSIASELAWSARRLLRAHGLPDEVSVSARWQTEEDLPTPADVDLTVTVTGRARTVSAALAAALENGLAARSLTEPAVHVSVEGVN